LNLDVQLDVELGLLLLHCCYFQRARVLAGALQLTVNDLGLLDDFGEGGLGEPNQLVGTLWVFVIDLEPEMECLAEVVNDLEAVLPVGVQVVEASLRMVHFQPVLLASTPLHL
jgi:hypothetical protein